MEKLATSVCSEAHLKSLKDVYVCTNDSLEQLPREVEPLSRHFGMFLAMDASNIESLLLREIAAKLIERGLVYLVAWGPNCREVEDDFDRAYVEWQLDRSDPNAQSASDILMTTSHPGEPLSEALWYFLNCAEATEGFTTSCRDWLAVSIGNSSWADEIRIRIQNRVESQST